MFCSGYITLIIICLVLGLLLISSDFLGSADTSNARSILHPTGGCLNRYLSIPSVSSYLAIAPLPVSVVEIKFNLHYSIGRIFLWSCSTRSRGPEFLRRSVLGCTDFPHPEGRDYPAALFYINYTMIFYFLQGYI